MESYVPCDTSPSIWEVRDERKTFGDRLGPDLAELCCHLAKKPSHSMLLKYLLDVQQGLKKGDAAL